MIRLLATLILGISLFSINASKHALADGSRSIWVNDMDHVVGDVKQGFIQNRITTQAAADNLINGFKAMKVDGIRIPIFAEGLNPNKTMFDYFYDEAVAAGFAIYANPAQHSGAARIACGVLNEERCDTLGDNERSQILIDRIKDFASEYKCDWIGPFNEDGAPGADWTSNQMNDIFSSLEGQINGADLIGPDVWGIPASIRVMRETSIGKNIEVAGTHNLGFNHSDWPEFIALAEDNNLPVWDTEVNDNDKFGTGTRLDAALDADIDGLVLYNSWTMISLTNGSINAAGQNMMSKYLKFRTDRTYYIDNLANRKRLATDGESESPYTTDIGTTGSDVEWKFVDNGNGYYHLERAAGGSISRLRSDNTEFADMQATSSSGAWTYFNISQGPSPGAYYLSLPAGPISHNRLQVTGEGDIKMVTTASQGSWTLFTFSEVDG